MHYTETECLEMLPKWRESVTRTHNDLVDAIESHDWGRVRKAAVDLRWAGSNLRGIANDLIEAGAA